MLVIPCILHLHLGQLTHAFSYRRDGVLRDVGWASSDQWAYNKMTAFTAEDGSYGASIHGVGRYYLVQTYSQAAWSAHAYERFDLRGKTMKFNVDLSGMQCRCAGTFYFSYMKEPGALGGHNYCDIFSPLGDAYDGSGVCTEVDIMEANTKAFHSALHTEKGEDVDGTCNHLGCVVNFGVHNRTINDVAVDRLYGKLPGAQIDTTQSFAVQVEFDSDGVWSTTLSQNAKEVKHFNASRASNPAAHLPGFPTPTGIPEAARQQLNHSNRNGGFVMVLSTWGGFEKLDTWLNGQCGAPVDAVYAPCDASSRRNNVLSVWGLSIADPPSPPPRPPATPPPPLDPPSTPPLPPSTPPELPPDPPISPPQSPPAAPPVPPPSTPPPSTPPSLPPIAVGPFVSLTLALGVAAGVGCLCRWRRARIEPGGALAVKDSAADRGDEDGASASVSSSHVRMRQQDIEILRTREKLDGERESHGESRAGRKWQPLEMDT